MQKGYEEQDEHLSRPAGVLACAQIARPYSDGTRLNGRRVDGDCEVRFGDEIEIGPLVGRLRIPLSVFPEQMPRWNCHRRSLRQSKTSGKCHQILES